MPNLERPKFIQIVTGEDSHEWFTLALDEAGDVWKYSPGGWHKQNMERLDD